MVCFDTDWSQEKKWDTDTDKLSWYYILLSYARELSFDVSMCLYSTDYLRMSKQRPHHHDMRIQLSDWCEEGYLQRKGNTS